MVCLEYMDYTVKFKRLEKGKVAEKGYDAIPSLGLQYQRLPSGKGVPPELFFAEGIILSKFSLGQTNDQVVPKGRTLEITFKEE